MKPGRDDVHRYELKKPVFDRGGMTMVEMLVAISMFAIVMTVTFTFLVNSRRSYSQMSQRVEYQQAMRATVSLMTREIRSAGCDPANAGFDRLPVADDTQFQCRMDLDGDGAIEIVEPAEDVMYLYRPLEEDVIRNSGFGVQTILRNVTAVSFRYFDATGAEILPVPLSAANRSLVRSVEIDLTGLTDQQEEVNYITRVLIRNG
jgi:prepilin-type N-terminal cleavage/methylation domain-containing protein